MRCLFCKQDSSSSSSIEHIIPESLGNLALKLKRGVVCDKCNNYFSREVERQFLEAPAITNLRFHQSIVSKKGRVPPLAAVLMPSFPATLYRDPKFGTQAVSLEPDGIREMFRNGGGTLLFPGCDTPPPDLVVSRFLAKAALETMAKRLEPYPEGLAYLVDEPQFDPIRRHAREGFPKSWPYHARRIYDADRHFVGHDGKQVQTVHESDILLTASGEYYYVLAIFGLELVINYGGPEVDGYRQRLREHSVASPLDSGRNSGSG